MLMHRKTVVGEKALVIVEKKVGEQQKSVLNWFEMKRKPKFVSLRSRIMDGFPQLKRNNFFENFN
jgi:hypothetical protein